MSFITDPSQVIFKGHFEGMVSIIDQAFMYILQDPSTWILLRALLQYFYSPEKLLCITELCSTQERCTKYSDSLTYGSPYKGQLLQIHWHSISTALFQLLFHFYCNLHCSYSSTARESWSHNMHAHSLNGWPTLNLLYTIVYISEPTNSITHNRQKLFVRTWQPAQNIWRLALDFVV